MGNLGSSDETATHLHNIPYMRYCTNMHRPMSQNDFHRSNLGMGNFLDMANEDLFEPADPCCRLLCLLHHRAIGTPPKMEMRITTPIPSTWQGIGWMES